MRVCAFVFPAKVTRYEGIEGMVCKNRRERKLSANVWVFFFENVRPHESSSSF